MKNKPNYAFLFDLDGVLVESTKLHFEALNSALGSVDSKFLITEYEQKNIYEGLTTREKFKILNKTKNLPETEFENVYRLKQIYTHEFFKDLPLDKDLIEIFKIIKDRKIKIGVVSNSIRKTLDLCLNSLGIYSLVDFTISNEDVLESKPSSEGYLKAMSALGAVPETTVIFEDSVVGRKAAAESKANLIKIDNRNDLTKKLIKNCIKNLKKENFND